jgi:5'-nucleotidase
MENIFIKNHANFDKLIQAFSDGGAAKMHVLTDFDRTLTYAYVNGQKTPSVICQLRNGNYLSEEYALEAHALFNIYHAYEMDPDLSHAEKSAKMREWWDKHHKLLIESGLTKKAMNAAVAQGNLKFREGALEFFEMMKKNNIPVIIMSAGPGYMIAKYLELAGQLSDNIHIIANWYKFGLFGKVTGVKDPVIHSLNKYEIVVRDYPIFKEVKNRKNVLLMGDGIDDVGMITGFEYDNLLKIGFLNDNVERDLEKFSSTFDAVITKDNGMEFVNETLGKVLM